MTNQSATWNDKGLFFLPLNPEHYLPFSGAAKFGLDNVTLDWPGYGGLTLENQVVAGYVTNDFYLGALGLSPLSVNVANFSDQYPSFLGTLKAENHIPSKSYGYTAGASYRSYPVNAFGSLTLGGYDSTRMIASKNLTIVGGSDSYRPFLLGIEHIRSESTELLDAPIITSLDSIVSEIWLPISACRHFESVFGLVWNSSHNLYIVNDTQHSALLAQNASITFTLSTGFGQNKDDRLNITLPYAAFDHTAKPPFAGLNETVYCFPLKQAANSTQYTLGRTFLQETYMIADYDRVALSLFPAVFPDSSIHPHLVGIKALDEITITSTDVSSKSVLSRGAVIGIVIGGIVFLVLLAAGVFFYIQRNRREKARILALLPSPATPTSDKIHGHKLESPAANDTKPELPCPMESDDWKGRQLSSGTSSPLPELPSDHGASELRYQSQIHELA